MAIAFDTATTDGLYNTGSTSYTYAHNCSGTNRLLIVAIYHDTAGDVVTGVTYNGVAMTQVNKVNNTDPGDVWEYMYYLLNPASGSNNITVTSSSSSGGVIFVSSSYTGVAQTGQPDSNAVNNGSAGSASTIVMTTTTVANNSWTISTTRNGFATVNSVTNGTGRVTNSNLDISDSNSAVTPAGSYTMTYNLSATGTRYAGIIASFAPAILVTDSNCLAMMLGVGK